MKSILDQPDTPLTAIAKTLANLPKQNPSRQRVVVLTSGPDATIVAKSGDKEEPKTYAGASIKL